MTHRTAIAPICLLLVLAPPFAFSQQSYGRVDLRCLRSNNSVSFKAADPNVAIGYAAENENPHATIAAQKPVGTNWTLVTFQFCVAQDDRVKVILRGRYRETEPTGEMVPEWVWVDNVSVTDTNGVSLIRNGGFEKLRTDGRPDRWEYKGGVREIRFDPTGLFPQEGVRCIKVWHSLAAYQGFPIRSHVWYTLRAWFRAE